MARTTAPTRPPGKLDHSAGGPRRSRSRLRARAGAVAGAVAAALAIWGLAALLGVDLAVRRGGGDTQAIGPVAVAASSLVAGLAGWGFLAVLERLMHRARRVWAVVAVAVLVVSLVPVTGAVTASAAVALVAMHLAVAAVLIPRLATTSPSEGS